MLIRAYLPQILTALFGGLFVWLGIMTFDNPTVFDRLFIFILLFTAFVCRRNINIVGVIIVVAIHQILGVSAWFIFNLENTFYLKIAFYLFGIAMWYKVKYDPVSKLLLISLLLSFISELYWYISDIEGSALHWYIMVLSINLLTRHLIFQRVNFTDTYFPNKVVSINLDWHIYKLNALAIIFQTVNIFEYMLRGVFGLKDLMYVYDFYSYAMQAISTYTVFIIFSESYKLLLPKLLRA
jgi:hypothetical protein